MAEYAQTAPEQATQMLDMLATIRCRGVTEARVLAAMAQVPRHVFVPHRLRGMAYEDHPVGIGGGQTVSQPFIVAYMTEMARLQPGDRVLEVGTGSGYQAAVLAHMGAEVYSIEIIAQLARHAKQVLQMLDLPQVRIRAGDASFGWPDAAPFAAILVTAAAPRVPDALREQLKPGGRLIIPVGDEDAMQELQVWMKTDDDGLTLGETMPVRFVPMMGAVRDAPTPTT